MAHYTLRHTSINQKPTTQTLVSLNPKTIFIMLTTVSVILILISFIGVVLLNPYSGNPYTGDPAAATPTSLAKLVLRFDVVSEGNIPSWYSGAILLISSILLMIIALHKRTQRDRFSRHWIVLAVLFLLFSLDEVAYLHEGISNFMGARSIGSLQIGWILPGAVLVLVTGLWFSPFILKLPQKTKRLFILAASLFLTGALGLEFVESLLLGGHDFQSVVVVTSNHLQDLLEMIGVCVFIYALLSYIGSHMNPLRLAIR